MKVVIDYTLKTIEVLGECSLEEFINLVNQMSLEDIKSYKIIGKETWFTNYNLPYYTQLSPNISSIH